MNGKERVTYLERQGIINFAEAQELSGLREEQNRLAVESEERRLALEKEHEGKQAFVLKYRRGNIFQDPEDMEVVRQEIWAQNATEAAEIACGAMISGEIWGDPTGVAITDAASCRLDVFEGDQLKEHKPIWVNPYGIAPSQIKDGGPTGWAETAFKALTGKDLEIHDGRIDFRE